MTRTILWPLIVTAGFAVMIIGVAADSDATTVTGAVIGAVGAVIALIDGGITALSMRRSGPPTGAHAAPDGATVDPVTSPLAGVVYAVAAIIAGAGFASWFIVDDSDTNLGGVVMMVVGALVLWGAVLWKSLLPRARRPRSPVGV
jgi:hypothetical protein